MKTVTRATQVLLLLFVAATLLGEAQKADTYIHEMEQALPPGGHIEAPNCHKVEIHPASILTGFGLATGTNEQGELLWNIYSIDTLQFEVDMTDLNEDKVMNNMVSSVSSISHHTKGTPYPDPDLAVVLIPATKPKKIEVHAVNLDKLASLSRTSNLSESAMGATIEQRPSVFISFSDKDRADKFVNALKKAIIACKAQ